MKTTGTLQGGMVAPAGVTAPEPEDPARISPHSKPHRPTGSKPTNQLAVDHLAPPRLRHHPCRLTANATTRPRDPKRNAKRRKQRHRYRAGGTHLPRQHAPGHRRGRRPDAAAGHTRPPLARPDPNEPTKPRRHAVAIRYPRRQPAAARRHAPASWRSRRRLTPPPARPGPDGARRAQIWAERVSPGRAAALPGHQGRRRRPAIRPRSAGTPPPRRTAAA